MALTSVLLDNFAERSNIGIKYILGFYKGYGVKDQFPFESKLVKKS